MSRISSPFSVSFQQSDKAHFKISAAWRLQANYICLHISSFLIPRWRTRVQLSAVSTFPAIPKFFCKKCVYIGHKEFYSCKQLIKLMQINFETYKKSCNLRGISMLLSLLSFAYASEDQNYLKSTILVSLVALNHVLNMIKFSFTSPGFPFTRQLFKLV